TPQDFLAFRKKLGESSGFQSFQMRQLVFVLGLRPARRRGADPVADLVAAASAVPGGEPIARELEQSRSETSLRDALLNWLYRTPIQGSSPGEPGDAEAVNAFLSEYRSA